MWIAATLFAAAVQTLRFALQRKLRVTGFSTAGASYARFLFAAPLACTLALVLSASTPPELRGDFSAAFWGWALLGGTMQILATMATVALFAARNFAVGIAFTKTEVMLVALLSPLALGDAINFGAGMAIVAGFVGVLLLSLPKGARWSLELGRAPGLGLLAGVGFALSAIGYRGAALALDAPPLLAASITMACVTTFQVLLLSTYLRLRQKGEITRVFRAWRVVGLAGVAGFLGTFGWIYAFALMNATYVRALGQVELLFSVLTGWLIFGERLSRREVVGMAVLTASVVALLRVV